MLRIPRDRFTYQLSAAVPPVARIAPGDALLLETFDASTGRIRRAEDLLPYLAIRDPLKVNPAAGPIYVEGAEPGDALTVEILDIRLQPPGFIRATPGAGVLQVGLETPSILMVEVDGDHLVVDGRWRLPARPMIGVIGTAPASGVTYTAHPGPSGGNLDVNAVAVGGRIHLPVRHPGALLAIGDVHASMGEGEVSGTGVEINGEVTVRVELLKGAAPARPWLETADAWIATGQGPTLDDAVGEAVEGLTRLLMDRFDLDRTEAFLLVSARGDVRIGQCARIKGCDATAFAVFPKGVERLG